MSAQAATSFAVTNPTAAAQFTAGELQVAPSSSTAAGTYYLARRFILAEGTYVLKVWADDVATAWLGTEQISARRLAVATSAGSAVQSSFYVQQGMHRIDLTLLSSNTATPAGVVLSIWKDGTLVYASSADGWRWDTTAIPDADLPDVGDVRLGLPVFTTTPNWAGGVLERLSWLTEVMTSESAVEQRRSLRRYPRRSFEASFLRADVARQRIDNFVVGVGHGKFLLPLWHEQFKLSADLSGTSVVFPDDTLQYREFWPNDLVLLSGADPADYEIATVASRSASTDTIVLTAAPARTWPAGSRITPLRVARFDELPQFSMITDRLGSVQMRFNLDTPETHIEPSWGYCAPLWRFGFDRASPLQISTTRTVYTIDVATGIVDVTDPSGRARVGCKADVRLFGRERVWAFRAFAAMARGKAVRFWWPSGTHDVEPVGVIGGATLDVAPAGFADWMTQPQDVRRMLGIVFNDGRPTLYRRVLGATSLGIAGDRLALDQPLPEMSRSAIERVMWMWPARFDQDGFELQHVTDSGKAVGASVTIMSSDIDGMPDIDCWVTSMPYPAFADDELSLSATVTGGSFGGVPNQYLALDMSAAVTGGSFPTTVVYRSTSLTEALDLTGTVTGGSFPLIVGYETNTVPPEAIETTATVTGGTITIQLISAPMSPEAVDMSASVTSGTMT